MKKQTSIFAVFLISLFVFANFTSAGVALPEVTGWTWSEDIKDGAYLKWEVSMHNDTEGANTPVTTPGDDGPAFVNGSIMELWVTDDPYNLQFPDDEAQYNQFFNFNFDGNGTLDIELFPVLLFPNTYQTVDGDYNYFAYTVDNSSTFVMFENENNDNLTYYSFNNDGTEFNATIEIFHEDTRYVRETFIFGTGFGDLRSFTHYEVYTDDTVLVASIDQVHFENGSDDDDFFMYASFDDSLDVGDSFTWDITLSKLNGVDITTFSEEMDGPPPVDSTVTINIVGEPENLNFSEETNPNDYFEFFIDDQEFLVNETFDGPGDFIQFIFPKNFDFQNGTTLDFFEYAATDPTDVWDNADSVSATLEDGLFTLMIEESGDGEDDWSSSQTLVFDAENGVMQYLHRSEQFTDNGSPSSVEFTLVLQGFTDIPSETDPTDDPSDDESSDAELPLPGFTFFMFMSAIIAIPILRRK